MVEIYRPVGADPSVVHDTPQFKLGARAYAEQDQVYVYCKSSGALALGGLAVIDEDFTARGGTTALAAEANGPGWPQVAFATDQYGWVPVAGRGLSGKMKDGIAANALLYTSTSVGIMGSDGSTGTPLLIAGCRTVAAGSGAGALVEMVCVNPHFLAKNSLAA